LIFLYFSLFFNQWQISIFSAILAIYLGIMKRATRVAVVITIFLLHVYFASIYLDSLSQFWSQIFTPNTSPGYQEYVIPEWMNSTDKAVVMAKIEEEDTEWVTRHLPE